jgi:hypothetical protein
MGGVEHAYLADFVLARLVAASGRRRHGEPVAKGQPSSAILRPSSMLRAMESASSRATNSSSPAARRSVDDAERGSGRDYV